MSSDCNRLRCCTLSRLCRDYIPFLYFSVSVCELINLSLFFEKLLRRFAHKAWLICVPKNSENCQITGARYCQSEKGQRPSLWAKFSIWSFRTQFEWVHTRTAGWFVPVPIFILSKCLARERKCKCRVLPMMLVESSESYLCILMTSLTITTKLLLGVRQVPYFI